MDMLLSNPVGRGRVIPDKFRATVLGTFMLAAVMGVSLVFEGRLVGLELPADKVAATMFHLALLGVVFGALALSAGTGRTGLSRGVRGALAVFAYIVNALAPVVDVFDRVQKVSPFSQYIAHAVMGFRRRDVAA